MEWILAVEGVGFPSSESDLSATWNGTAIVSNDINGDLATVLGCSITKALNPPNSISDEFDPEEMRYSSGGITFDMVDVDDLLAAAWQPNSASSFGTELTNNPSYSSTTINIDDGSGFVAGDVVWINGREAVKLGTKAVVSGTTYTFTSSTRGYLGTVRGNFSTNPDSAGNGAWKTSTAVYDKCPFWLDRRVVLYLHVPGETRANLQRIYTGRIRDIVMGDLTNRFKLTTVSDDFDSQGRMWIAPKVPVVEANSIDQSSIDRAPMTGTVHNGSAMPQPRNSIYDFEDTARRIFTIREGGDTTTAWEQNALRFQYNYRNRVPGGTHGALAAADSTPQANLVSVSGADHRMIQQFMSFGGSILKALWKLDDVHGDTEPPRNMIVTEGASIGVAGNIFGGPYDNGIPVRYLLDSYTEEVTKSRFVVNNRVARNIVDVMLMFLTSYNGEFLVFDTTTGSTTTSVTVSGGGLTTDEWAGYALHCVEGANLGQARLITGNSTTAITVSPGFSNAASSGEEYQVRNTIYDVLPLGWGLQVHNSRIDIDSFETMRDTYYQFTRLGGFAIGDEDVDIWDMLSENICRPYGILTYNARTTGKLSAKSIISATTDWGTDQLVAVAATDILDIGDITLMDRPPVSRYHVTFRSSRSVPVRRVSVATSTGAVRRGYESEAREFPTMSGGTETATIELAELESQFGVNELSSKTFSAMFHSRADVGELLQRLTGRLIEASVPLPQMDITLSIGLLTQIEASTILLVNDTTIWSPPNPHASHARGWTNVLLRVLSTEIVHSPLGVRCRVQILQQIEGTKIAPAALVTGKGTHGSGTPYLDCADQTYTSSEDAADYDWKQFFEDAHIELRDKNGALKETFFLESFGSNEVADPSLAASSTINVREASISSTIASGDYVTLAQWSTGSGSSSMEEYAAGADANGELDGLPGREYF